MDIYEYFSLEKEKLIERIQNAKKYIVEEIEENIEFHIKDEKVYINLVNREQKRQYVKQEEYKKYTEKIKKAYYCKQIKYDQMYLTAVNAFLRKYNPNIKKAEVIIQNSEEIAKLLFPEINNLSKKIETWFEANYQSDPPYPEKRILTTIHGEKVRSKSERLIANTMLNSGVPYRYECMIKIDGIVIHPDFIIRHPKTGKYFIWEHLGRADDEKYLLESFKKIELYAKEGFVAGNNLIITTETAEHPLDIGTVNEIIRRYFLN